MTNLHPTTSIHNLIDLIIKYVLLGLFILIKLTAVAQIHSTIEDRFMTEFEYELILVVLISGVNRCSEIDIGQRIISWMYG